MFLNGSILNKLLGSKTKGKSIEIDGNMVTFPYLLVASRKLEIWCESERTKKILTDMPYGLLVHQIFDLFRKEAKLNLRYLLVTDESSLSVNWYFFDKRTWVITLNGLLNVVADVLKSKNVSMYFYYRYLHEQGIHL